MARARPALMLDRRRHFLQPRRDDLAKLVLRVTLGGLTLFHGVDKLANGLAGVRADLANAGAPAVLAYGVYLGEVVAPMLVVLGIWTRAAAVVLGGSILFATVAAHPHAYASLTPVGAYAAESYVFYMLVGCVVALSGAGRYALRRGEGRWD